MKKKVLIYLYQQCREIEIMTALSIIGKKYEIFTFSDTPGSIRSECGLTIQPGINIKRIRPLDYEMLIIPGGKNAFILGNMHFLKLLQSFDRENIYIAAIGNAPILLGKAGILSGRSYTVSLRDDERLKASKWLNESYLSKKIVQDKNLLTAKSHAYLDFGLTIGDRLKCFDSLEEYNFYKGICS
ncbi:hypothetical protein AWM68_17615 [Fictibacillus phosphorivorans]|uniref:DJ-1/PfpI domain-containing protein n=1 Tax=Fictibacillus phosphorivorans TaxID=1221500 RepID=A0A165NWT7_9BACL|nr:DJ-1/PfpI family protein [Fictibacillus phosphorivorans]KZE67990.1 hypothetical protein AWM68_17615 [Fictibacillus phosphorivorans]